MKKALLYAVCVLFIFMSFAGFGYAEQNDSPAAEIPAARGADSVRTLLEKTLEFVHSGCDYAAIADVHDKQAHLAYILIIAYYDSNFATEGFSEFTWEEAMKKAALIMGDAETLKAEDPELAEKLMSRVTDPDEAVNSMVDNIRAAIRDGSLTEEDPNYELASGIMIDWDKGSAYNFEHYPEVFEDARKHGVLFSLEDAMAELTDYVNSGVFNNDLKHFKNLEAEYHPENAEAGRNGGIFYYDVGTVTETDEYGNSAYNLDMVYCFRDGAYYLIDYNITCW